MTPMPQVPFIAARSIDVPAPSSLLSPTSPVKSDPTDHPKPAGTGGITPKTIAMIIIGLLIGVWVIALFRGVARSSSRSRAQATSLSPARRPARGGLTRPTSSGAVASGSANNSQARKSTDTLPPYTRDSTAGERVPTFDVPIVAVPQRAVVIGAQAEANSEPHAFFENQDVIIRSHRGCVMTAQVGPFPHPPPYDAVHEPEAADSDPLRAPRSRDTSVTAV